MIGVRLSSVALALVCGGLTGCSEPSVPADADLVLLHGTVWTGLADRPIPNAGVVVRDGRIAAVGPVDAEEVPPGVRTIDLAGGFLLPGLIDNHVHVLDPLLAEPAATREGLRRWLCAGVTTLVDNGSALEALETYLSSAPPDDVPTIFGAGPIFTAPGGYPFEHDLVVTEPEEARAAAARVLDAGASFLKVAAEAGFLDDYPETPGAAGSTGSSAGWPVPTPDVLSAIAAAAHERNAAVRAHVTQPGELRAALDAGFDAVAHTPAEPIPEPLLHRAAEARMTFVTTAFLWQPDPVRSKALGRNLLRYHQLGGAIVLGTDAPGYTPGYGLPGGELRALRDAGLGEADVLRAATVDGAVAIGRGGELGTVEVGKRADLLVVRGDPLTHLLDLERAEWVLLGGEVVRSPRGCGRPDGD